MALEIVHFDKAVEKLAMDEEPFAARAQKKQFETEDNRSSTKDNKRKRMSTCDDTFGKRGSPNRIHENTMSKSIKHKYVVRSRHEKLTSENRFMPVNKTQAKQDVKKETLHDPGEPIPDESRMRNSIMMESVHGKGSVFKNTSPVTQDQL